jgi:hypothetical protein
MNKMKIGIRIAVVVLLSASPMSLRCQQIVFDGSDETSGRPGFQVEWDSESQRMIAYRDASDSSWAAVRVFSTSGRLALYPLKDFPGANYVDIWAVAGSGNSDIVLSVVLGYGPRNSRPIPVKTLVLTYDAGGTLRKAWDVDPYLVHHLASDSMGNVFALAEKGLAAEDYPLLIKYSTTGEVLREGLSTSLFPGKALVVGSGSPTGEAQLFIKNEHLFVWIATTQELFDFTLDGIFLSKISLSSAIQSMIDQSASSRVRVLNFRVDSSHGIVCQVQLWPKDTKLRAQVALAHISPTGSFENWIEPPSRDDVHRFLGLSGNDKNLFLEKVNQNTVKIVLN